MYESENSWRDVDRYFVDTLVNEDDALRVARASGAGTTMPLAEIAPNQGKWLELTARMIGAKRVLEFGTLAGYSTIWLARAVGEDGHVTSLEYDEGNAAIARDNIERAGLSSRVDVVVGAAAESVRALIDDGVQPFDLVFIDADKPNNPLYLATSLQLTRVGSVIVTDNVVRDGRVIDAESDDDRVRGVRDMLADIASHPHLEATAIQTVGSKGWDGFSIALVTGP